MPVIWHGEPGDGARAGWEAVRRLEQARHPSASVVVVEERQWATKRMAAEHFGVSERTIDNWREKRGLPAHRIGRVLRFDLLELDRWFAGRDDEDRGTGGRPSPT